MAQGHGLGDQSRSGSGLNHLTAIPWPASVVSGLAALMENPTVALNEMLPTSKVWRS